LIHVRFTSALLPIALALLLVPVTPVQAQSPWSATIGATTDYIFRGVSQTYDSGAVQVGGSYQSSLGWFAGAWASNVNPYPHAGASAELDLYAGYTRALGSDFSARFAYTHYTYVDDPRPAHYDYDELSATIGYLDRLAATLSYQPNYSNYSYLGFARHEPSGTLEVTGRWPVKCGVSLTAGAGYYDLHRVFGVSYWAADAGVSYVYRRLSMEVGHYFAEGTVGRLYGEQTANGTWTLSATLRF
jgi:uncharacterized protein (TIGR02001 family)